MMEGTCSDVVIKRWIEEYSGYRGDVVMEGGMVM